jgi:hypothetical protein
MPKRTLFQRAFVILMLAFAASWFGFSIAAPIVEFRFGRGPLAELLLQLRDMAVIGIFILLAAAFVLRRSGALPRAEQTNITFEGIQLRWSWKFMLVSFVSWILVALALVEFFAVAPNFIPNQRLTSMLMNVLPMTLLVVVWVSIMASMRWQLRRKQQPDSASTPPSSSDPIQ